MNNKQRSIIKDIQNNLEVAFNQLEDMENEEQEKLDNLPENLQNSEKGEKISECIDILSSAKDSIQEIIDNLNEI